MKNIYFLFFLFLVPILLQAQVKPAFDTKISLNKNTWLIRPMSINVANRYSESVYNPIDTSNLDSINTSLTDTMKYNIYGDLLNDNPLYNPKSSLGMVALKVTLGNVSTFLIDRYIFNYDFSRVGFNSWKYNIKTGWEWDNDRFAMNNFFHPFSGGMSFNSTRANGYTFFESVPFAALGSLEWEYFGETTLPSYNDIINTTINGAFLGEMFYRLGSDILDDETTGADRFFREMAVAFISPTRFFSRLLNGNISRLTPEDVYQKEPLNVTISAGYHRKDAGTAIGKGTNSENINLNLDYGNPFEKRSRKPFDYFNIRTDLDFGVGRKIIDNITGYGILFGKNLQVGNTEMLVGLFQHINYFDNITFELATMAFGPGIISKLPMSKSTSLYTDLHLNIIPFGSLSGQIVTDTSQFRDYNYGGGAEAKFESTLNIGGWVDITIIGYYWWFHTFVGVAGNSYIAIVKPRIAFKLFNNISIGFEQLVYFSDRYPRDFASVHEVITEQKVFFQLFLEEFKFKK
jgi:hypothetical protein